MNKQEVLGTIRDIGIIPVIRASSGDEAKFAVEAVAAGGIPLVEITMTVPGGVELIRELSRMLPGVLVGAGTVLDADSARECVDAGAQFLVTPGLNLETVEFALKHDLVIMAGALTPTEVLTAWNAGSDLVKVFPCAQVGGPSYIKALRGPFPGILLVPTGGVNLHTAAEFILAGSAALGVGADLVLAGAVKSRAHDVIRDTARHFVEILKEARRWAPTLPEAPRRNGHRRERATAT